MYLSAKLTVAKHCRRTQALSAPMKPRREYTRRLYEYDALNLRPPNPEDNLKHYVTKHKQKQKDLEVVFDPKGHRCALLNPGPPLWFLLPCAPLTQCLMEERASLPSYGWGRLASRKLRLVLVAGIIFPHICREYLTGFRKRKQQRREEAQKWVQYAKQHPCVFMSCIAAACGRPSCVNDSYDICHVGN